MRNFFRYLLWNQARLAFGASAAILAGLIALLAWDRDAFATEPLVVFCAASIKPPAEEIAREYEHLYGVPVQFQFGSSETLLAAIELSGKGDLYLPADDSYLEVARTKRLIDEVIQLARMAAVLAVQKGNPKKLHCLEDLMKAGVRYAQADPEGTAIGKLTKAALEKSGCWEPLARRRMSDTLTVTDLANEIQVGAVDAGFVWDATVRQYPKLQSVTLPQLNQVRARVAVAVLKSCKQPASALRFARFLAARDRGLRVFEQRDEAPAFDLLPHVVGQLGSGQLGQRRKKVDVCRQPIDITRRERSRPAPER